MIWFVAVMCWLEVVIASRMLCVVDYKIAGERLPYFVVYIVLCCTAAVFATVMAMKGELL